MRLGIFGGSFNPVHIGHLVLAQDILVGEELDRVIFIPAFIPPHKLTEPIVDGHHRLEMLRLAVGDDPRYEVSDVELARGGVSYTIDTVHAIIQRYPDAELFFIIGGDTLPELHTWRDITTLLRLCTFVTVARPGYEADDFMTRDLNLPEDASETLLKHFQSQRPLRVSSTEIRMRVAQGKPIRYLVPDSVADYIRHHGLYENSEAVS